MNPAVDPCVVTSREKLKYVDQFNALHPVNGVVTGGQARDFFLQSQLPPLILGQIWALADTDSDGKMTLIEFSIACKLINLKLRGFEVPKTIPPVLLASLSHAGGTPILTPTGQMSPLMFNRPPSAMISTAALPQAQIMPQQQPPIIPPMPAPALVSPPGMAMASVAAAQPPITNHQPMLQTRKPSEVNLLETLDNMNDISILTNGSTPKPPSQPGTRSGSLTDTNIPYEAKNLDWAIKGATKLKYTQLFNTTDRDRLGYLTGVQARNIMVMTKLPQAILAQIWNLSDMDNDGKLGSDEFVLAMHLCEMGLRGETLPTVLPPELIPPSFRNRQVGSRSGSISSRHDSVTSIGKVSVVEGGAEQQHSPMLPNQTSFEDKRKENFDKGQAELERRRKVLLDAQRKEKEERERKEREEYEKKERIRLEAERKKQEELERQLQLQREMELEREEERKRQIEQKEAAKKEMERQRQLEWEKQKLQEMEIQRQREQEGLLKLKAQNQEYTVELSTLNEKIKGLSQSICETRASVTNVKTVIDGMRTTRDTQNSEMASLKNKIKEQNAKLVQLSQEKVRVDAKTKDVSENEQAFSNRQIMIQQLKARLETTKEEIVSKTADIENHSGELGTLKDELSGLITTCEDLYTIYETQRNQVLEMKQNKRNEAINAKWDDSGSAWNQAPAAAVAADSFTAASTTTTSAGVGVGGGAIAASTGTTDNDELIPYRAIYAFEGRNEDELSFMPGDIIQVPLNNTAEPGWLAGQLNGRSGWFPDAYVERLDDVAQQTEATNGIYSAAASFDPVAPAAEVVPAAAAVSPVAAVASPVAATATAAGEYYVATYPYQSTEPGDLLFDAGETILVTHWEGDWWTGQTGGRTGIFPANYVTKMDDVALAVAAASSSSVAASVAATASSSMMASSYQEEAKVDVDSEVSEINTKPAVVDNVPMSASQTPSFRAKKSEIAQVIAPYEATTPEQLSLTRGQLIMIRKKTDSGWWEGELQAKGRKKQVGWFPATYVKVLQGGRNSGRNTPLSASRADLHETILDKVIALYPYKAQNDDELSFEKDDIISVVGRDEPEWWRGELNGLTGLFPSNYVGKFVTSGNV